MNNSKCVLILSDLHVGGGASDPGDDHIFNADQLELFIQEQMNSPSGQNGQLELFFNGDFLEFVQTDVEAFGYTSDKHWCMELESLRKLNTIINGHRTIFRALKDFQNTGNIVTIAAGNHDVDLFWIKVQDRIREVAGENVRFETGQEWVQRFDGKLQIGHGHMSDAANRFKNWSKPIETGSYGIEYLEMCPGTLFMVKFVNKLEAEYPFADNLLPVTKLASVLLNDDKAGFASVGWMFTRFIATTAPTTLKDDDRRDFGYQLLSHIQGNKSLASKIETCLAQQGMEAERLLLVNKKLTLDSLASLMFGLLGRIEIEAWRDFFDLTNTGIVLGSNEVTLSTLLRANAVNNKEELRKAAKKRAKVTGASVVVMGHTHQLDEVSWPECMYYNPGSWTRYLELDPRLKVKLDDLKDESKYPYSLNVVRVEEVDGALRSEMICIETNHSSKC